SSASASPRSAKTLPEPSSNSPSAGSSFFILRPLLCLCVSSPDQINILLWCPNSFVRFLLEGMQHVDLLTQLDSQNRSIGIGVIPQGDLDNAAANSLEGLGILGHSAKLHKL